MHFGDVLACVRSVCTNLTAAWFCQTIGNRLLSREDVFVVSDLVQRGKWVDVTRIRPNGMSDVVHNGQATIVAVESRLDTVRRREHGRNDLKVEGRKRHSASGQDIIGIGLLYAGLGRRETACGSGIFVGHPLASKIAPADVIKSSGSWPRNHIDRGEVVIEPAIRIHRSHLCPSETTIS